MRLINRHSRTLRLLFLLTITMLLLAACSDAAPSDISGCLTDDKHPDVQVYDLERGCLYGSILSHGEAEGDHGEGEEATDSHGEGEATEATDDHSAETTTEEGQPAEGESESGSGH